VNSAGSPSAGLLGCGYALPTLARGNDDAVYQYANRAPDSHGRSEFDMFDGAEARLVLGGDEEVESLMAAACSQALAAAGVRPEMIDRLYGYASVPDYFTPNPLYKVHRQLQLAPSTLVVPVNCDFSNFLVGLVQASESVRARSSELALVTTGSNWTRHVDHQRGHANAVGDGAGAAVIGPSERFIIVDYATRTLGEYYPALTMAVRPRAAVGWTGIPVDRHGTPLPTYAVDPEANVEIYHKVMWESLPRLVNDLLSRHNLHGDQIALISHQGSRSLLDRWADQIRPAQHLETLATFGNMACATYPVNLAFFFDEITAPYLVMAAVGTGLHLTAILIKC
jgi:3-oxoacyl-[acyl-carrier-protein] synthase-3